MCVCMCVCVCKRTGLQLTVSDLDKQAIVLGLRD